MKSVANTLATIIGCVAFLAAMAAYTGAVWAALVFFHPAGAMIAIGIATVGQCYFILSAFFEARQ